MTPDISSSTLRASKLQEPHPHCSFYDFYSSLPVPEGADRKDGEGLFTRVCRDRTRGNGSELRGRI